MVVVEEWNSRWVEFGERMSGEQQRMTRGKPRWKQVGERDSWTTI